MDNAKPLNFILIGRSGSGKGTQADLIKKKFSNMVHVTTGDLMRDLASKDTQVASKIKKIMQEGGLPYDDMATTLWMHKIACSVKEEEGIICDGFPRRVVEAQNLDRFFEWLERKDSTKVLFLDIAHGEAFTRLKKRGREIDDNDEAIRGRMTYFEDKVMPVVSYYKESSRLIDINGEQPIKDVFKEILEKIK